MTFVQLFGGYWGAGGGEQGGNFFFELQAVGEGSFGSVNFKLKASKILGVIQSLALVVYNARSDLPIVVPEILICLMRGCEGGFRGV